MSKKITLLAIFFWLLALSLWQLIFNSHQIISPILWEIHTIFTSVIVFYILTNLIFSDKVIDLIKIIFRILFKVWFVIFIAFSIKKSFNLRGFLLTATFVFGYLEGLIDINAWINNNTIYYLFSHYNIENIKMNRLKISILFISIIHILSAFIAFLFFNIT